MLAFGGNVWVRGSRGRCEGRMSKGSIGVSASGKGYDSLSVCAETKIFVDDESMLDCAVDTWGEFQVC